LLHFRKLIAKLWYYSALTMRTKLGRTVILVDDYDKAFDFYERNFLCKKLYDDMTPSGQRLLHIGFSEDQGVGVWLLKAEEASQKQKLGRQTEGQPTLVIYTDDVEELYYHVQTNGVQIIQSISIARESKFFHCLDLYGNKLTIGEL
jgi:predicted enzyme related to lactoylglutathione lyase